MAPTITSEFTQPGKVMGTAAYMSPEQSRGQEVDRRTDVWAFGCCLYEALTGKKPFKGQTVSDLMADILRSDPDFTVIPPETPGEVMTLLRRCLEKEPQRRLRDLGDIAITLEDVTETSRLNTVVRAEPQKRKTGKVANHASGSWSKAVAIVAIAASAIVTMVLLKGNAPSSQIRSLAVTPFENLKPQDTDSQYYSRTIQDALKLKLGSLERWTFKPQSEADATISGTFFRLIEGKEEFLVNAKLTDRSKSETPLGKWRTTNVLDLEVQIATAVVDKLGGQLTEQERGQIKTPSGVDPAAYRAYRRGLAYLDARQFDEARNSLKKAIELDDKMDEARVYLFTANFVETIYGGVSQDPGYAFREFNNELDNLPTARRNSMLFHPGILNTTLYYDRDWTQFRELALKFTQSRHSSAPQVSELDLLDSKGAFYCLVEGRLNDLVGNQYRAMELDPDRLIYKQDLVFFWWFFGRYDEALKHLTELQENFDVQGEDFTWILLSKKMLPQAKAMAERISGQRPKNLMARCNLAAVHVAMGNLQEARIILADLEDQKRNGIHVPYAFFALPYGMLGDFESAFRHLRDGVEHGRGDMSILSLRTVPMLELFSEKPDYWTLVDQLDFPPLPSEHPYYETEQRMRYGKDGGISSSATNAAPKTLAVLPFVNLSADKSDEYLSLRDGLAEELIDALGRVGLQIPGRSSSFAFKDATEENLFRKVGEQLRVSTVLEGSVRKSGNQLRILARLVNVDDGFPLWSATYDRDMTNTLALQTEIATRVAEALKGPLGVEERRSLAKTSTENPEAYRLYRLGRYHFSKSTEAGLTNAVQYFNQALQQDPNYALAYCGLADCYGWMGGWMLSGKEAWAREKELAKKAIALDPDLADAHLSLGIAFAATGEWNVGEQALKRALELNERLELAYSQLGWIQTSLGRFGESIDNSAKAIELDPLSLMFNSYHGGNLRMAGRFDEAKVQLEKTLELDPNYADVYTGLGWYFVDLGEMPEAIAAFQKAKALDSNPWLDGGLVYAYARAGDREQAEQIVNAWENRHAASLGPRMCLYLGLGEKDRALDWIEKCFEQQDPYYHGLKIWRIYDPLRTEPRFQAVLKKAFPEP
jgi:TolB-like protein/Tfp pilus assembly protein PilF